MPRPGKEPLKRFHLEKGPVYRHCSLCIVSGLFGVRCGDRKAYYRAHGSPFVPFFAAAANFCGSKPVMLGFARVRLRGLVVGAKAGRSANWDAVYAELTMRASLCGYVETQRESEDCRRGLLKQLRDVNSMSWRELGLSRIRAHLHRPLRSLPPLESPTTENIHDSRFSETREIRSRDRHSRSSAPPDPATACL